MEFISLNSVFIASFVLVIAALSLFIFVFLQVRLLIRDVFRNISEITRKVNIMYKNREFYPEIERISKKLLAISNELKFLNNDIGKMGP